VEADVLGWLVLAVTTVINTTLQQPLGQTKYLYTVQNCPWFARFHASAMV
jgi:hypothetical protein